MVILLKDTKNDLLGNNMYKCKPKTSNLKLFVITNLVIFPLSDLDDSLLSNMEAIIIWIVVDPRSLTSGSNPLCLSV